MLIVIQTLLKQLHRSWRSLGGSSFQGLTTLVLIAYVMLSLELAIELFRAFARRGLSKGGDMRRVQAADGRRRHVRSVVRLPAPGAPAVEPAPAPITGTKSRRDQRSRRPSTPPRPDLNPQPAVTG